MSLAHVGSGGRTVIRGGSGAKEGGSSGRRREEGGVGRRGGKEALLSKADERVLREQSKRQFDCLSVNQAIKEVRANRFRQDVLQHREPSHQILVQETPQSLERVDRLPLHVLRT